MNSTGKLRRSLILFGLIALFFAYGATFYPFDAFSITGNSLEPPSWTHLLGTDDLGSDIFAQLSGGFFNSMLIGLSAAALAFILGGVLGILAAYFGGKTDDLISFVINVFLSIPQLPIMIVIGAFFGQSKLNIVLIVALFSWARVARLVRSKALSIINSGYIRVAKGYGAGFWYIVRHHVIHDVFSILMVNSVDVISKAVIQESSLAFLGLSDPSSNSWGLMIDKAISFQGIYFTDYWKWWVLSPLIALVGTTLSIRLVAKNLERFYTELQ